MPPPGTCLAEKLLRDLIFPVFRATTHQLFQIYLAEMRRGERQEKGILSRHRVAATDEEDDEEDPYHNLFSKPNSRPETQSQPEQQRDEIDH